MPSDALILGFDTSAAHCAAALVSGDTVLAHLHEDMARGQAERLLPLLEEVLAQGGAGWGDLSGLGVGTGPGNFTGIRIAVAAARGLSLALGVPAIGVNLFEARAQGLPRPLIVVEDARREMIYIQEFGDTPAMPRVLQRSEFSAGMSVPLIGTAAQDLAEVFDLPVLSPSMTLAVAVAKIAQARLGRVEPRPVPLYLRAADAAPPSDPPPRMLT